MIRRSFRLSQLLRAVLWVSCAGGAFVVAGYVFERKIAVLGPGVGSALVMLGIPAFLGFAAAELLGWRIGCVFAALCFYGILQWVIRF